MQNLIENEQPKLYTIFIIMNTNSIMKYIDPAHNFYLPGYRYEMSLNIYV